jgi:hypothetical protein
MAKKSPKRKAGRKRSATKDLTTRKANQAKGGGAVAGVLYAAFDNNDAPKPPGSLRSTP